MAGALSTETLETDTRNAENNLSKRLDYISSEYEKGIWREAELHALEEIKKAGVKVTYPEKEQFREMVQPMYDEFKKDEEMKKTIEAIQAVK